MTAPFSTTRTRIVIAHCLGTVMNLHRIVVLERGRAVESGRHADLAAAAGAFARFARRQLV